MKLCKNNPSENVYFDLSPLVLYPIVSLLSQGSPVSGVENSSVCCCRILSRARYLWLARENNALVFVLLHIFANDSVERTFSLFVPALSNFVLSLRSGVTSYYSGSSLSACDYFAGIEDFFCYNDVSVAR